VPRSHPESADREVGTPLAISSCDTSARSRIARASPERHIRLRAAGANVGLSDSMEARYVSYVIADALWLLHVHGGMRHR
jgi:hypothetical protein